VNAAPDAVAVTAEVETAKTVERSAAPASSASGRRAMREFLMLFPPERLKRASTG
jgi:hypothetical protein